MYQAIANGKRAIGLRSLWIGLLCLMLTPAVLSHAENGTQAAHTAQFTVLDAFSGINGAYAVQGPVQGPDGNLYGTTLFGGTYYAGNLYQLTSTGMLTTIYNFCAQPSCADGSIPNGLGTIALDADGNVYGSTTSGGSSALSGPCAGFGCGTIFKITPGGTLTTLYNFCSQPNCVDGDVDSSGVVRGVDGNFYGTTPGQGSNVGPNGFGGTLAVGCGTVFKITPQGAFTTIYSFCAQANCADGISPYTGLTAGADGNLYGITSGGGANGYGTIFKLTRAGSLTTLHSFSGSDGSCSYGCASMIQAASGNFYGVTLYGGTNNWGTVFEVSSSGTFQTLYNFCSQLSCADGGNPNSLVQASDGNFYGGASYGGDGGGIVFKLTPGGVLTAVHVFEGISGLPGGYPGGQSAYGLTQATNGLFYGTTTSGGAAGGGTLFSLATGLPPFVQTLTVVGVVGATVDILGTNLTDATGVHFNGVAAPFTVTSSSLISAAVPAGATTGWVTVTTPSGTLRSIVRFRIKP